MTKDRYTVEEDKARKGWFNVRDTKKVVFVDMKISENDAKIRAANYNKKGSAK